MCFFCVMSTVLIKFFVISEFLLFCVSLSLYTFTQVLVLRLCCFFFFFKQKTAYEMRISDWSSDVCSSDLPERDSGIPGRALGPVRARCPGRHARNAFHQLLLPRCGQWPAGRLRPTRVVRRGQRRHFVQCLRRRVKHSRARPDAHPGTLPATLDVAAAAHAAYEHRTPRLDRPERDPGCRGGFPRRYPLARPSL